MENLSTPEESFPVAILFHIYEIPKIMPHTLHPVPSEWLHSNTPNAVPAIKIITYDGLVPRNSRADVAYQLHYEPHSGGEDTSQSRQQSLLFAARTDIIARMENRLNKARAPSYNQEVESKAPIYNGFGYSLVVKEQERIPDQKNHEYLVVTIGCN
jgi:hypothetical protein